MGERGGPTFCVFIEVWRGLLPGKFPPGRREQKLGFLPARENRSRARARTRKRPRACEVEQRHKPGARIAHRRCARRRRGWHGKRPKSQGAELSFFGRFCAWGTRRGFLPARENRSSARARTRKEPRACAAQMQTQTRCASCPPQVRVRARRGEEKDTVRDLPGAAALEKAKEQSSAFQAFLCVTYSRRYPAICQQTDADPETGCMEFDIEKGRFSFRLTAPYSEERRRAASEAAKAAASNLTRRMV